MLKLLRYMREYLRECILAPAFKLLEASFELFIPLVVASIIDRGIEGADRGHIIRMALVLVLLALVGFASAVVAQYFSAKASVGFAAKVRGVLFGKIQSLSYTGIDKAGTSTLVTRMTSDINQLQSGVNLTLRLFLRSPFIVFGAMIMAFTVDVRASLVFAVMIPALSLVVFGIMLLSIPLHRRVQSALDLVTGKARENLTGVRILRGFCKEDKEKEAFGEATGALERAQVFVGRITALMNPVTYLIVNASVIVLIYSGALRVDSGLLSCGQLVALYNYMTQILVELVKLASLIITITKAVACGQRIQSVLELDATEREGGDALPESLPEGTPRVKLDNVSFRYPGASEYSLTKISFSAYPGETIGIIGGTGSGKSTIVNLIPGFYDATEGTVSVDGVDVSNASLDSLRGRIGVVPQKASLFRGTLRDNLRRRKPEATDVELLSCAETAMAADVIEKKGGLDAHVEQGGKNFSGGQRQRLTVAIALVGSPEILILDDSSSALDYATDAALREAIGKIEPKPTAFIVSQRTSSIMHADRIIVLEDGEAVGIGTHSVLLDTCPQYRAMYELQFGKREEAEA